jgi:23S rRNA (uracil1939-C5)-methyltransferase
MPVDCPHAERCPGCALIRLSAAEQLAAKAARVGAELARHPVLRPLAAEPVRAAETVTGYRTRAKLAVAPGARIGLFARGGHDVIDLPECRVLAPAVAAVVASLRRLLASPPPGADPVLRAEGDGAGRLRAIDVREVVDETGAGALLTLVVRAPEPPAASLRSALAAIEAAAPGVRAIALSLHDGRSPQLLGGAPRLLAGAALHRDVLRAGAPWSFAAPGGFAQAHRAQAAAIHEAVETALAPAPGRRALDVFAGGGALGLALAARGASVWMIESFAPAAEAALAAAREQGLAKRVRAVAEPAERAVPRLLAAGSRFDAAVVNPPRRGCAPRLREALAALARDAIAYVSCEPATLARDLAHLAWLGWRAGRVAPYDMMPLTAEVECLALLHRAPLPPLAVLYEDDELLAVDKPPFLATVPHPERAQSLLTRVRARRGLAGAAPLHRLDAETSGVCLFAKRAEVVATWQRALAAPEARKRYAALVRGVGRGKGRVARPLRHAGRDRDAATRYRRSEVIGGHALLEITLETGRTHQIRRHLAAIGEPVLGDARHGHAASNRHFFERWFLDRAFLHCASIELAHPASGAALAIEAPLAPDLAAVLERVRGAA